MSCVISVVMFFCHVLTSLHAFGVHGSIKNNICGACGDLNRWQHILDASLICKWCTIFLFSMLYKIPFFCVVQNSCFLWCTIFLKNGMMYLIPVWHVVPSSVVGKSFFSNFECCTIFWCIQVCVPFWSSCHTETPVIIEQLLRYPGPENRLFPVFWPRVVQKLFYHDRCQDILVQYLM